MDAPAPTPLSFRILSLNTHKGFTHFNRRFILHELREAVRGVSADLVFLQEVLGSHREHSTRYENWPKTSQYEFLADTLWSDYAYGRNAVYPGGDHGNALLSKFPILRYENLDVSIRGPERRGLLHCTLRLPGLGREMHAVCVHLGLAESHRREQLKLLCRLIDGLPADAPLMVAGDFNDWRMRAHAILQRCASLREVFVEALGRAARTFPARWPLLSLDRIYVRNVGVHLPEVLHRRPWSHLSDHAALTAEIRL
ncbi:MAG TPA: endonuclease/exonuclease/phosphatase family protein [Solimonas sp.]|nr:endonuclease/exonuclease/phosphatase family protein [Solimonas sp.]